jgi:branched-chain amino acid transport system substrate-binding protein
VGPQAVITGNWGNDLTLLVKAAREAGFEGKFYTFYGNALGAPAAIGEAGIGQGGGGGRLAAQRAHGRQRGVLPGVPCAFPKPADDYVHLRMQLMVEALAQAIERAGSTEAQARGAGAGAGQCVHGQGQGGPCAPADHQFQQPLVVGVMDRQGAPGVKFDVEGSGYGFRVVRAIPAAQAQQPHACTMAAPLGERDNRGQQPCAKPS